MSVKLIAYLLLYIVTEVGLMRDGVLFNRGGWLVLEVRPHVHDAVCLYN